MLYIGILTINISIILINEHATLLTILQRKNNDCNEKTDCTADSGEHVRDTPYGAPIIVRVPGRREGRNGDTSPICRTTG